MIVKSTNTGVLQDVCDLHRDVVGGFDPVVWLARPANIMYVDEDSKSVGLANYEYNGVYTIHWFFRVHGREAIELADKMAVKLFEDTNAKALRGLTRTDLRHAKITARKLGMKGYGNIMIEGKEYEILCMTKEGFFEKRKIRNK